MAFSFGFYNSLNKDRRYNAIQISMIFDGIIRDGVYATIGKSFIVKASEQENTVIVQPGRAWFNHTWNYNDADLPIKMTQSDLLLDRIDALVIDINSNEDVRLNNIILVKGAPSSNPQRPVMVNTLDHHQYPLCYIHRKPNTEIINQEDITNMVGSSECPFVTGVLETVNIDELLLQWEDQWSQFIIRYENEAEEWTREQRADFTQFYTEFKTQMNEFEQATESEFSTWFNEIKGQLSEDAAGNLELQIQELNKTRMLETYTSPQYIGTGYSWANYTLGKLTINKMLLASITGTADVTNAYNNGVAPVKQAGILTQYAGNNGNGYATYITNTAELYINAAENTSGAWSGWKKVEPDEALEADVDAAFNQAWI